MNQNYPVDNQAESDANVVSETITRQYMVPRLFLFEQFLAKYRERRLVFWVIFLIGALLTIVIVLAMPLVYTANITVMVRGAGSSTAGSITSALGLTADPGTEVTLRLNSNDLTRQFIIKQNLLKDLKTCPVIPFLQACPTGIESAVNYFNGTIRSVAATGTDSFVISVGWSNPKQAAAWANGLVALLNEQMQQYQIVTHQAEVDNYAKEAAKMNLIQIQPAIYSNLAAADSQVVVARSTPDYGVTVIDPAVPPPKGGHEAFLKITVAGLAFALVFAVLGIYLIDPAKFPWLAGALRPVGSVPGRLQRLWRRAT